MDENQLKDLIAAKEVELQALKLRLLEMQNADAAARIQRAKDKLTPPAKKMA